MIAVLIVIQLSLGISGIVTVHAILDALILRPLPFKSQDKLVMLWEDNPAKELVHQRVAPDKFRDWQTELRTVRQLTAYQFFNGIFNSKTAPERVEWMRVSPNFFDTFQLHSVIGRLLVSSDSDNAMVISEKVWTKTFAGNKNILGTVITMSDRSYTIVGVASPSTYPADADVWTLLPSTWTSRVAHSLYVVGIVQDDYDLRACRAELSKVSSSLALSYPDTDQGWHATATSMRDEILGDSKQAIQLSWIAAFLVLFIACFNVANLMSVRLRSRKHELAVKIASGATRFHIFVGLLMEPVLLAFCATLVGLYLATLGTRLPTALLTSAVLHRLPAIVVNLRVLLFSILTFAVTILLAGVVPALPLLSLNPIQALNEDGMTLTKKNRMIPLFVTLEVALSVCLLWYTGLALRSLLMLNGTDPGFNAHELSYAEFGLPRNQFQTAALKAVFIHSILTNTINMSQVADAAITSHMPLTGGSEPFNFIIRGQLNTSHSDMKSAEYRAVSPNLLSVMGIPLLRGRNLADTDTANSPKILLINLDMAKHYWPNTNPLDREISIDGPQGPWRRIVGIVGNTREDKLDKMSTAEMYFPLSQETPWTLTLVAKSKQGYISSSDFQELFSNTGSNVFPYQVNTVDNLISDALTLYKSREILLSFCSLIGSILAFVGIYSFLTSIVSQSILEIGIKIALGATPLRIGVELITKGFALLSLGISAGITVGFAFAKMLHFQYYGVSLTDLTNLCLIAISVFMIGSLAILGPALRVKRVQPVAALRRN